MIPAPMIGALDHAAGLPERLRRHGTPAAIARIGPAFGDGLLDVHSDPDHHRSAFTLAGEPGELARRSPAGRAEAVHRSDRPPRGRAPPRRRRRCRADHLPAPTPTAARPAPRRSSSPTCWPTELELPVFLYGSAGRRPHPRRAPPRRPAGAGAADRRRRAAPRLRPAAACIRPPARCSSPPGRRWWRSTSSSQPPATLEDARRSRPRSGRAATRGCAGLRAIGLWLAAVRPGPGVHQRRGPSRHAAGGGGRRRRPPRARGRRRARRAGSARPPSRDFPRDVPLRGYATIEDSLHRRPHSA